MRGFGMRRRNGSLRSISSRYWSAMNYSVDKIAWSDDVGFKPASAIKHAR